MGLMVIKKVMDWKAPDDDFKNFIKNKEFNEIMLPEEIKEKYNKIKIKDNCGIKNCDCIALLLSIKEINDDTRIEITKKKYDFFDILFNIPLNNWDANKSKVEKLFIFYNK